jgi:hypothetical protein
MKKFPGYSLTLMSAALFSGIFVFVGAADIATYLLAFNLTLNEIVKCYRDEK